MAPLDAVESRVSSSASVSPLASQRPTASTNPSYRSHPFACAAACVLSGSGGTAVSQKRTKSASISLPMVPVAFEALDLAGHTVEAAGARGFETVGPVGREMRCERGFHDVGLRYAPPSGVVGELRGEFEREAERVLAARGHRLQLHAVGRVERDLSRQAAEATLERERAYHLIVGLVVRHIELSARSGNIWRDRLVLGQLGFAANAGIGGIIVARSGFRPRH